MSDLVLAITGASGALYSVRLLQVLVAARRTVHLTISPSAAQVIRTELGISIDLSNFRLEQLMPADGQDSKLKLLRPQTESSVFSESDLPLGQVHYHHYQDYSAGIASGSFRTGGMVICPCSMGTLSSIAAGLSTNLIHRAADVHLKERRKLIVVPRETPLSGIQLANMTRLAEAGAVVLPAAPGFYHDPVTIHDLVDFVVGRICDQLGIQGDLTRRWGAKRDPQSEP